MFAFPLLRYAEKYILSGCLLRKSGPLCLGAQNLLGFAEPSQARKGAGDAGLHPRDAAPLPGGAMVWEKQAKTLEIEILAGFPGSPFLFSGFNRQWA